MRTCPALGPRHQLGTPENLQKWQLSHEFSTERHKNVVYYGKIFCYMRICPWPSPPGWHPRGFAQPVNITSSLYYLNTSHHINNPQKCKHSSTTTYFFNYALTSSLQKSSWSIEVEVLIALNGPYLTILTSKLRAKRWPKDIIRCMFFLGLQPTGGQVVRYPVSCPLGVDYTLAADGSTATAQPFLKTTLKYSKWIVLLCVRLQQLMVCAAGGAIWVHAESGSCAAHCWAIPPFNLLTTQKIKFK